MAGGENVVREVRDQEEGFFGTPAERWELMWELALQAWVLEGKPADEFIQSRLRRDVGRVIRGKR
ncbi:MAG: hypothetical protein QM775_06845 [Pirellulales bacterium]